jgi:hypothetical protein
MFLLAALAVGATAAALAIVITRMNVTGINV